MSNWHASTESYPGDRFLRAIKRRIAATLALAVGGIVWVLLYAAFWATHFNWYQNLAVVLSSILIVPTVIVAMWVLWGVGLAGYHRWHDSVEIWDTW